MATRYSVSLVHAGCDHTGFVVWEERGRADARGTGIPVMVGLPRGFVSLNGEDGSIEIVCAGCRQTIASAARADASDIGVPADPFVAETAALPAAAATSAEPTTPSETPGAAADPSVAEPATAAPTSAESAASDAAPHTAAVADQVAAVSAAAATSAEPARPSEAADTVAPAAPAGGETAATPVDTSAEDKLRADIEALFAEAEDVAPIRGDAIPPHLLDKLRHLADRMRQRRE